MGTTRIIKFIASRALEVSVIIALLILLPNLPPHAPISESYRLVPIKPLSGKLAINEKLDDVEIWHKGDFRGPEHIEEHDGELYVGLLGGDVVKLVGNDHIVPVVKLGKPCGEYYEEKQCGRPLGLKFDKDGQLYVADSYYGLWKVDVKSGKKELLVSPDEEIDGKVLKVFNSVDVASNGDIYFSHSSSYFDLHDGWYDILADPSGRLIRYDPKTKTKTVLIDKIGFANGVVLSDDEEFVLVSETTNSRILRYYLKGSKKGTHDVFIDGIPGLPDNLSRDGKGGFLVPLVLTGDEENPMPHQFLTRFPSIRKVLARLFGITEWVFQTIDRYFPNEIAKKAAFHIGHFASVPEIFFNKRITVLRVSKTGEIIDSLHTMKNKIANICDALIVKDTLYLGSFRNDYIVKIPLSKIGWDELRTDGREKRETKQVVKEKPIVAPKVQTTTPPPTNKEPAPQKQTPPPKQEAPAKQTTPPPAKKETVTPKPVQQQTPPPKQEPAPTKAQTPPQKAQTVPPKQQAEKQAPPPKAQTPPAKQEAQKQTPPPKKETPPPKQAEKQAPPPKVSTQPPKQAETQPPKQQPTTTPPAKQATPQKQQDTPPKQATPKQQQDTPPKQATPKPQQATPSKQAPPPKQQGTAPKQVPPKEKAKQAPVKDGSKNEL